VRPMLGRPRHRTLPKRRAPNPNPPPMAPKRRTLPPWMPASRSRSPGGSVGRPKPVVRGSTQHPGDPTTRTLCPWHRRSTRRERPLGHRSMTVRATGAGAPSHSRQPDSRPDLHGGRVGRHRPRPRPYSRPIRPARPNRRGASRGRRLPSRSVRRDTRFPGARPSGRRRTTDRRPSPSDPRHPGHRRDSQTRSRLRDRHPRPSRPLRTSRPSRCQPDRPRRRPCPRRPIPWDNRCKLQSRHRVRRPNSRHRVRPGPRRPSRLAPHSHSVRPQSSGSHSPSRHTCRWRRRHGHSNRSSRGRSSSQPPRRPSRNRHRRGAHHSEPCLATSPNSSRGRQHSHRTSVENNLRTALVVASPAAAN